MAINNIQKWFVTTVEFYHNRYAHLITTGGKKLTLWVCDNKYHLSLRAHVCACMTECSAWQIYLNKIDNQSEDIQRKQSELEKKIDLKKYTSKSRLDKWNDQPTINYLLLCYLIVNTKPNPKKNTYQGVFFMTGPIAITR